MLKITDFYMLCKWENLQNRQCIKYLFSLPYTVPYIYLYIHSPKEIIGTPVQFPMNAII